MKRIVQSVILLAFLVQFSACNAPSSKVEPGEAYLSATIEGMPNAPMLFINTNPFIVNPDTVTTDQSGSFTFKKFLDKGTYFEVNMGRERFPLFLIPGDSMTMTANAQAFYDTQKFSGAAALYNNYLTGYTRESNKFEKSIYQLFSSPEKVAVAAIDSVKKARTEVLDQFTKANPDADAYFLKMERARILYEWALLRNIYPLYFRYLNKMDDFELSPEYMSYLGAVDVNDSALLGLSIYQSFLDAYLNSHLEEYYKNDSLRAANPSQILYRLNLIDKLYENEAVKQVLAYKSVMNFIQYDGIKDYDLYFDKFKEMCPYKPFQDKVQSALAEWQHLKKGQPAYEFTFVDMKGNKISMSDFRGKYVYVDVWATWCNPCRKEIPYLKKMEEDFHGKNIVFVSISVDKTQEPWRAMVENDSLKGIQLWAGQAREFSEFYKITGIPRFMLFDRDGKILEASATRPSGGVDKQLAELPGI
jgi:thiol-disulfide isomerase/thioredoxin